MEKVHAIKCLTVPRQLYTCLPGNFRLYIVYDLGDAIFQLDCSRIFL